MARNIPDRWKQILRDEGDAQAAYYGTAPTFTPPPIEQAAEPTPVIEQAAPVVCRVTSEPCEQGCTSTCARLDDARKAAELAIQAAELAIQAAPAVVEPVTELAPTVSEKGGRGRGGKGSGKGKGKATPVGEA